MERLSSKCLNFVILMSFFIFETTQQVQLNCPEIQKGNVPPGQRRSRRQASTDLTPTPCPDNLPYCESDDDYPLEEIQKALNKQPREFIEQLFPRETDIIDTNRFSPGEEDFNEVELCTSVLCDFYPTKVKSEDTGKFDFVVNTEKQKQGIRLEKCLNRDKECTIPGGMPNGYVSQCVQKSITRLLVVVNQTATSIEGFVTKPYEFPSCCSCHITFDPFGEKLGLSPAK